MEKIKPRREMDNAEGAFRWQQFSEVFQESDISADPKQVREQATLASRRTFQAEGAVGAKAFR